MRLTTVCFLFFFLAGAFSMPRESDSAYSVQALNSLNSLDSLDSLDPLSESNAENNAVQVRSKRSDVLNLATSVPSDIFSSLTNIPLPSPVLDFFKALGVKNLYTVKDLFESFLDGSLLRDGLTTITSLPAEEIDKIISSSGIESVPVIGSFLKFVSSAVSIPRDIVGNVSSMIAAFLRSLRALISGLAP